jgi:hypothetical protein
LEECVGVCEGCLIEEVGKENKDIVLEDKEFARTID